MVRLLIVRHGVSLTNSEKRYTGQRDVPLAPLGLLQGEAASRYLAEHYPIDAIYSSDLCRAKETLMPLAKALSLPIVTRIDLREIRLGEWEGKTYEEVQRLYPETYAMIQSEKWRARYEGGESYREAYDRAVRAFSAIAAENEGKTVAVASHGGTVRLYLTHLLGIPFESNEIAPALGNASLTVVELDGGKPHVALYGFDGYLEGITLEVDKNLY